MTTIDNTNTTQVFSLDSTKDDNFDTDTIYQNYWFVGRQRLTGYDIKPNVYYWIRLKNESYSFANYALKEKNGNTLVFEYLRDEDKYNKKIIEFDIDSFYAYQF